MTQRTIDLVEMLLKQAGYKQEGQMYVHHTLKSAFSVQELFPKPESPAPSVGIGLVEALERDNPYITRNPILIKEDQSERQSGYQQCLRQLRELIEAQPKDKPVVEFTGPGPIAEGIDGYVACISMFKIVETGKTKEEAFWEAIKSFAVLVMYHSGLKFHIQPAPLSGSIEGRAMEYANQFKYKKGFEEMRLDMRDAFIAGHNSQPSVRVLVDALNKVYEKDGYEFVKQTLQQFNTGEEKQEQDRKKYYEDKIEMLIRIGYQKDEMVKEMEQQMVDSLKLHECQNQTILKLESLVMKAHIAGWMDFPEAYEFPIMTIEDSWQKFKTDNNFKSTPHE